MSQQHPLEKAVYPQIPWLTWERLLFILLLIFALFTRFYDLERRVMSHDESLHTYFSWLLYRGQGYQHNPMMHGPLQFHLIALSYFIFGANDATARIPAVIFNIATIGLIWYWRRYLGRVGALLAGLMLLISPYSLYYGRYVRNESYAGFSGVLMLYAMLRYLESGEKRFLYWTSAAMLIHFAAKETAFIYAAIALLLLAIAFITRITAVPWPQEQLFIGFVVSLSLALLLLVVGIGLFLSGKGGVLSATETAAPANPLAIPSPQSGMSLPPAVGFFLSSGLFALGLAIYFLVRGYGWEALRQERTFSLAFLIGTLVLPLLVPFLIKPLEPLGLKIPVDAGSVQALTWPQIFALLGFLGIAYAVSFLLGWLWDWGTWWRAAAIFWLPFVVLFTTVFTNPDGFFTGTLGSLGYWLVQQGVQRGSQPWYYYLLAQIPIYEFLPFLGMILAWFVGTAALRAMKAQNRSLPAVTLNEAQLSPSSFFPTLFYWLVGWPLLSLIAFSIAGERMPWLTYHLAWPMILLSGWGLGYLVETTDWTGLGRLRPWLLLSLSFVFVTSASVALARALGPNPPFQGKELAQLQATNAFLLPFLVAVGTGIALWQVSRTWNFDHLWRLAVFSFYALLAVLTARAAFRAAYLNYDNATEFLVYAHSATGVKEVMKQLEEISRRTTGGLNIALAYDASAPDTGVSWPFVWYLRDYTNQQSFDTPTRALRERVAVIVDQKNFDKIEPALGANYYRFDYIRMWWPMQDYFGLVGRRDPSVPFDENYACRGLLSPLRLFKRYDFSRFCNAISDPNIRAGIFQIWLNRDYTLYARATGHSDLTLTTWEPSDRMRLYLRKDVVAQLWNYGVSPIAATSEGDPYEKAFTTVSAELIISSALNPVLNLIAPRAIAFAPDGTFYVTDTATHMVYHLSANGALLHQWGGYSMATAGSPAPGLFNEPWGIAVGPDGSVYVSDTWNGRIQKFTADGKFLTAWGSFGLGATPFELYGPRGLAVDAQGRVYVADTGNKRILVFDANGNYLTQFGAAGAEPGQFDEPVGLAVDAQGLVYVSDTWNQRVQVFASAPDALIFTPLRQWDVVGWESQSLENKPYIAVHPQGHVFVSVPEMYRILEFDAQGQIVRAWGEYGIEPDRFALPAGLAVDPQGNLWVCDAANHRIMKFPLSLPTNDQNK
ncbi:MAG: SMP-30/gluconolactonase/LRE family protein [Anaerolineales bacterium]